LKLRKMAFGRKQQNIHISLNTRNESMFGLSHLKSVQLYDVHEHEECHIKEKSSRLSSFAGLTGRRLCHIIESTNTTSSAGCQLIDPHQYPSYYMRAGATQVLRSNEPTNSVKALKENRYQGLGFNAIGSTSPLSQ